MISCFLFNILQCNVTFDESGKNGLQTVVEHWHGKCRSFMFFAAAPAFHTIGFVKMTKVRVSSSCPFQSL